MASIPTSAATIGGVVLSATTATTGPDTVKPNDRSLLLAKNDDTVAVTVEVSVPGNTRWGVAQPDVTSVSIPAGGIAALGNLPSELADPSDGEVHVTSSSTSVSFYAVRV